MIHIQSSEMIHIQVKTKIPMIKYLKEQKRWINVRNRRMDMNITGVSEVEEIQRMWQSNCQTDVSKTREWHQYTHLIISANHTRNKHTHHHQQ